MLNKKTFQLWAWLLLILLFAFWLRHDAFWLPHWKGDQNHYAVLAMKLDKQGLDGYNLREVSLGNMIISKDPPIELVFCRPSAAGDLGDILRILKMVGQGYYDEPLHFRAPLFSWCLMWSHRLFAGNEPFYGACSSNLGEKVKKIKPDVILKAQFWAAAVPIFFNLGVILMTFLIGWKFFSGRTGLWAAFLMASNPLSIFLAYKLLAEDVLTFFVCLSVFLLLLFYPKKNIAGIFLAGAAAGLAILAKQTAGILLDAAGIYVYFLGRTKKTFRAVEPLFLLYCAAAFLVSGFWFIKVYSVYGSPLHQPGSVSIGLKEDLTGWFHTVSHRPPPFIFFSLGVIWLSPLLAFALTGLGRFIRQVSGKEKAGPETMLWLWILTFFFFITEPWHVLELIADQEHRFFYMAYPAIAVLAAAVLDSIGARWSGKLKNSRIPVVVITAALLLNACWGIPQALKVIYENNMLF